MRGALLAIGSLLLVSAAAIAADVIGAPPETKSENISTARDLLSRLESPAEEDCALGYVMGVYDVHERVVDGRREAERARRLLLVSLRLRGWVFPGQRGRTYADTARWLAGSSVEELLAG
jgi:hypothetical protein